MDINQQAAVCEELLKMESNMYCSDCPSKIPRWASINFGVFICIRCSGVHRQMGVHISKVKSVNLDKWPAGKIDLFQNVSNDLINSYWEKNLPAGYRKPDANASNREVTDFMEDKYVRKKWANTDEWANDPAWLYENKPKKFQKYVQYFMANFGGKSATTDKKKSKKKAEDSSEDEWVESKPVASKKSLTKPPMKKNLTANVPQAAASGGADLLSFEPTLQKQETTQQLQGQSGNLMDMLGGGQPQQNNQMGFPSAGGDDGGFGDFQANTSNANPAMNVQNGQNPQNMTQQTINIQNLYQMYNANAHSANDKYSALDSMVAPNQNNNMMGGFGQTQPQQQQKQPFQPMLGQQMQGGMQMGNQMGGQGGFGGMQGGMQQNNMAMGGQFGQANAFGGQQQQQQQQQRGFQPNAFGNSQAMGGGMGNGFNQNQNNNMMGGARPQMGGAQGGFNQSNPMAGFQQTQVPSYSSTPQQQSNQQSAFGGSTGGFGQQTQQNQPTSNSFGSFQQAPQPGNNVFAGGLVDLNNLSGNQNSAGSFAFGQSPSLNMGFNNAPQNNNSNSFNSGFGGMNQGGGPPSKPSWDGQGQKQQQTNAFNGLVKF